MPKRSSPTYKFIAPLYFSILIILLSTTLSVKAAISTESKAQAEVTLEEYLQMVRVSHPLFFSESLLVDIEESAREASLGAKDWTLKANTGYSRFEGISGGIEPDLSEGYSSGLSLERSIWKTGGRLKAEINNKYLKSEYDPSITFDLGPGEIYESSGTLSYNQPLMKNLGGTLDRLDFELFRYSIDAARLQALEAQEEFTLSVALKFMDWVLLSEKRRIATRRLALAEAQLTEITKKRKANLVDEIDSLRAIDSKMSARANLLVVEANWKARRVELATLAGDSELYSLTPSFDIYSTALPALLDAEPQVVLRSSRVIAALENEIASLERRERALEDGEKPDLSLDASVGVKGAGQSLGSSVATDGTDASLTLNLNYPLGNRTAKSEVTKINLQIEKTRLERDKIRLDLYASLKGLIIQIKEFSDIVEINSAQILSARARTKEELKRYNQGRGDFTFVIQSQDSEERANLNHVSNAARYHALTLELKALMDTLLTKSPHKKRARRGEIK